MILLDVVHVTTEAGHPGTVRLILTHPFCSSCGAAGSKLIYRAEVAAEVRNSYGDSRCGTATLQPGEEGPGSQRLDGLAEVLAGEWDSGGTDDIRRQVRARCYRGHEWDAEVRALWETEPVSPDAAPCEDCGQPVGPEHLYHAEPEAVCADSAAADEPHVAADIAF